MWFTLDERKNEGKLVDDDQIHCDPRKINYIGTANRVTVLPVISKRTTKILHFKQVEFVKCALSWVVCDGVKAYMVLILMSQWDYSYGLFILICRWNWLWSGSG